ncbi:hypothetical protein [Nocardia farcinica]|uniref:hypothetical protein n=1 Tax=Nocardia farcinica TaxID=37329 RepID=UPI0024587027|nr:hypothetical protein [Nocardia farcinica]
MTNRTPTTESAKLPITAPRGITIPRDRSKDMVLRQIGWVGHRDGTIYTLNDDPLSDGREGGGISPLYETIGLWGDPADGNYGTEG